MVSYDQVRALASPLIKTGQSYSLPVPVLAGDGKVFDKVFLYSVNRSEKRPNPPSSLLVIDCDSDSVEVIASKDAFPDVRWRSSEGYSGGRYKELSAQAKAVYGFAREEVESGSLGESAKLYARLLAEITPDCLFSYYCALSPSLFTLVEGSD